MNDKNKRRTNDTIQSNKNKQAKKTEPKGWEEGALRVKGRCKLLQQTTQHSPGRERYATASIGSNERRGATRQPPALLPQSKALDVHTRASSWLHQKAKESKGGGSEGEIQVKYLFMSTSKL